MKTPLQKEIEALRNKVKDTLINFNAYMHEDTHGKTIMVDYDRFTDEIMQVFPHQSLPRFTRSVIEEAMPEDETGTGFHWSAGFRAFRTQFKENVERVLKDNEKEI